MKIICQKLIKVAFAFQLKVEVKKWVVEVGKWGFGWLGLGEVNAQGIV